MKCDRRTRCSRTLTLPINQPRLVRVHPKKVHISELKCSGWLDDYIRLKRADDGPTSGGLAAISFFQLAQFRIVPLQSSATAAERQGSPKHFPGSKLNFLLELQPYVHEVPTGKRRIFLGTFVRGKTFCEMPYTIHPRFQELSPFVYVSLQSESQSGHPAIPAL